MGFDLCVYTSSTQSEHYIKSLFKFHKIHLSLIVNAKKHWDIVQGDRVEILPSKFRIDLHVDDDPTVKANGDRYGFRVLIISADDHNWTEKVLHEAQKIVRCLKSRG